MVTFWVILAIGGASSSIFLAAVVGNLLHIEAGGQIAIGAAAIIAGGLIAVIALRRALISPDSPANGGGIGGSGRRLRGLLKRVLRQLDGRNPLAFLIVSLVTLVIMMRVGINPYLAGTLVNGGLILWVIWVAASVLTQALGNEKPKANHRPAGC